MKKKSIFLFTPWFMGVLFIVFAMSMAFATFYENDFGAVAAKTLVYNTKWFELLMLLMVINLTGQVFQFKLYKRKKLTILLFHAAFVLMIIGAGITRYFGFEGVVHIRENDSQNICTSTDQYLQFNVSNLDGNVLFSDSKKLSITSVKQEKYHQDVKIDDVDYSLKFTNYLTNAVESIVNVENGEPMVSVLISRGMMGRQTIFLKKGEIKNVGGIMFGFGEDDSVDVRITIQDDAFKIQSEYPISEISMMSQKATIHEQGEAIPFETMKIYQVKGLSIVAEVLSKSGVVKVVNADSKTNTTNKSALVFELVHGNKLTELILLRAPGINNTTRFINGEHSIEVSYSSLEVELPFSLKLEDFILERYPGSSSPSSYKSDVVLIDEKEGVNMPYSIYMNHILKYKGWRFYQSSYDQDERGTILSVNRDFAGMFVTYVGYFILFLFMVLSLINKNSAFRTVTKNFFRSTSGKVVSLLFLFLSSSLLASSQNQKLVVPKSLSNEFGKVLVQNQKGRTEPIYALSNDILRKVTKETEFDGYSPMQVFLGFYFDFHNWQKVPLIKISNVDVKKAIGINGDYAAFSDIVDLQENSYKLKQYVDAAYAKPSGARNKFDKEIIKVDERLNICFMIYSGEFMKILPVKDHSMKWHSPKDAYTFVANADDSLYLRNIVGLFAQGVDIANTSGDYTQANETLKSIINYQRNFAQYELPDTRKVNAEILYYKSKIYDKLFPFYASIGLLLLFILLYGIISQNKNLGLIIKIFTGLLIVGFVFHTMGLTIRWYVSGHAPMSNGYESMIFISWVTILAGFFFGKRSSFVLAATSVLGGFTLMVAHLSFMDPQITNLVPVLQSYWLTIHVSVITGSYGFLGLGAIIGIIVLILYSMISESNKANILSTIEELTIINYKALTIGLYLLTIGTFLGAIWANESWGRYWGWDPKETWSLITIIVYSFVIHSRMIKELKGFYAFNVISLFAFSSVLMTYFGVNYYLSGLHSYAGGDPVPVPKFVYVSIFLLVSLSILAYQRYRKILLTNTK
ncbi:MAG: c-type cytochrome biogenesis protein CcsB [Bacteroidales bacterium]|nr:c-type cytochrome biogenesis protein CcsB [Bacteroidales bacterium]